MILQVLKDVLDDLLLLCLVPELLLVLVLSLLGRVEVLDKVAVLQGLVVFAHLLHEPKEDLLLLPRLEGQGQVQSVMLREDDPSTDLQGHHTARHLGPSTLDLDLQGLYSFTNLSHQSQAPVVGSPLVGIEAQGLCQPSHVRSSTDNEELEVNRCLVSSNKVTEVHQVLESRGERHNDIAQAQLVFEGGRHLAEDLEALKELESLEKFEQKWLRKECLSVCL